LLGTISLFTSIPYGVAKAADCSDPKGFHAKMMCKLTGKEITYTATDGSKKKSNGFFQKLKNFGGTKIGESDN
jgi:hypothetical protein